SADGSDITLRAAPTAGGGCLLRLSSSPPPAAGWLKPDVEFRLRTSLRAVCGEGVRLIDSMDRRWPEGALGLRVEGPGGAPGPLSPPRRRRSGKGRDWDDAQILSVAQVGVGGGRGRAGRGRHLG